jgi:hypothetical protein
MVMDSKQPEGEVDGGPSLPRFMPRFETPFLDGFDGLPIKTHSSICQHVNGSQTAIDVDDNRHDNGAIEMLCASFLGVIRIYPEQYNWSALTSPPTAYTIPLGSHRYTSRLT